MAIARIALAHLSRRELLSLAVAAPFARGVLAGESFPNVHAQLLELAAVQERKRRARFAAVRTEADLAALQKELREAFLRGLDWSPRAGEPPPVKVTGTIEAEDYRIEKFAFESRPGYVVPALLYRPRKLSAKVPGIISPCGHSPVGKAADTYQVLHVNLVKRGYVVLTYDPVGQGERSQFWDTKQAKSRFNLSCGEHAVLGNPLYLLGTSLARYRIADGIRAIDYLVSLQDVDATRIGCVGNSGGGTLTAYIAALDSRVHAAAIGCYITTLPRRMANRIQTDPDADPEQDIFGFVSEGIDHAGLLALRAPRPTLVGSAVLDFFPIEGARESCAEAKTLYAVAGAAEKFRQAVSQEKHGLGLPLRRAVYGFFERWLAGRNGPDDLDEIPFQPRPAKALAVCADGQANLTFQSRPLLTLALDDFDQRKKRELVPLRDLLRLDPEASGYKLTEITPRLEKSQVLVVLVNGTESGDWRDETGFLKALSEKRLRVTVLDPRGVGALRPDVKTKTARSYTDPLEGVEENIAYNAFLVGKSLVGMRVTDVLEATKKLVANHAPKEVVCCGRADAALVACFAAAVEPSVSRLAVEGLPASFRSYFDHAGRPINAASILPGLLRDVGDITDVLQSLGKRKVLIAAGAGKIDRQATSITIMAKPMAKEPGAFLDWLGLRISRPGCGRGGAGV